MVTSGIIRRNIPVPLANMNNQVLHISISLKTSLFLANFYILSESIIFSAFIYL